MIKALSSLIVASSFATAFYSPRRSATTHLQTSLNAKRRLTLGPALEELGLGRQAKVDEVKAAYRSAVKTCHPDVDSSLEAAERFSALTEAYEVALPLLADGHGGSGFDWIGLAASVVQDIAVPLAKAGSEIAADEAAPFLRSVVSTASGVAAGKSFQAAASAAGGVERRRKVEAGATRLRDAQEALSAFDAASVGPELESASSALEGLEGYVASLEATLVGVDGLLAGLESVRTSEESVRQLLVLVRKGVIQVELTLQNNGVPVPNVAITWRPAPAEEESGGDGGDAKLMEQALSLKVSLAALKQYAEFWSWRTAASSSEVAQSVARLGVDLDLALKGLEASVRARVGAEASLATAMASIQSNKGALQAKALEVHGLELALALEGERRAPLVATAVARQRQLEALEALYPPEGVGKEANGV